MNVTVDLAHVADWFLRLLAVLLSWPVAMVVLAIIFRKPISSFLSNLRRAKGPGFEIEAEVASKQQEPTAKVLEKPLASNTAPPTVSTSTAPTAVASSTTPMPPLPPFQGQVLKHILASPEVGGTFQSERERELGKGLADTFAALLHERSYRIIYGSQLNALELANGPAALSVENARVLFEKAPWPSDLPSRQFDQWLRWLQREELVTIEGEGDSATIRSTDRGRAFLQYRLDWGLPGKPW